MLYVRLAVAVIAICFAAPAWAASILIGTDNGTVGELDTTTGTISNTFSVGTDALYDIAVDSNGNVFALPDGTSLISIDTGTQTSAPIGGTFSALVINALAFDISNTLFGAGKGTLYAIDTTTGADTAIGLIGGGYNSSGDLAFGPDGTLYGSSSADCGGGSDCLFTIDTTSGAGTLVGAIGYSSVFGLAFIDGLLYGMTGNDELFTINPATGVGSGILHTYNISGLTYGAAVPAPVPLPAALPLLLAALGFFGLIARRRAQAA